MSSVPVVLVDIRDHEGVVGRSYVRTYTPLALRAVAALLDDVAPELADRPADAAQTSQRLTSLFRLLGQKGLITAALAGIDMALWDLAALRAGRPLARLLTEQPRPIKAYRTLRATDRDEAAQEAAEASAQGFQAVKVKLGFADLAADLETITAITEATPPETSVFVDYNQALDRDEAFHRGHELQRAGVTWIEEPVAASDLETAAHLNHDLEAAIALGENLEGAQEVGAALARKACDILTLDVMRIGGVTGWQEAAALAAAVDIPLASHAFPEFSRHLLAASPTGQWLEYLDYLAPIRTHELAVERGFVVIPDEPGAGLDWDEDAIRELEGR
jgi:mandelate racemase